MKSSVTLMFALVMAVMTTQKASAWGDDKPKEIVNKTAFLDQAILEFNRENMAVSLGDKHECDYNKTIEGFSAANVPLYQDRFCQKIAAVIPPGKRCEDLAKVTIQGKFDKSSYKMLTANGFGMTLLTFGLALGSDYSYKTIYNCDPVGQVTATLTKQGQQLTASSLFFDPNNADIAYNVLSIESALKSLQVLPRQRKALEGFWNTAQTFARNMQVEEKNRADQKRTLSLTHRSFVLQASLLTAYYRYLKEDFAELAQFSSQAGGIVNSNRDAVAVIDAAIRHISDAYGLETDMSSKQVADYGRVFLDLLNNFSLPLTENELQTYIAPVMAVIGTEVVPTAEAYGDSGASQAVYKFKAIWEQPAFQEFWREKLSARDEKTTTLILNISNMTYKIGFFANV